MSPLVDQKHFSNVVRQRTLPEHSDTSNDVFNPSGSKKNSDISKIIGELPRLVRILAFQGDHPVCAEQFDLAQIDDRSRLDHLCLKYTVCQFKDATAYNKGRRLVGQHKKGMTIQIGRFQGLVEPLGYQRLPLPASTYKHIRRERQNGHSVTELAENWDVSESQIRRILKGEKPSVTGSADPIKQVFSGEEPPAPCRVGSNRGVTTNDK